MPRTLLKLAQFCDQKRNHQIIRVITKFISCIEEVSRIRKERSATRTKRLFIAAIAITNNALLLTHDKGFENFKDYGLRAKILK